MTGRFPTLSPMRIPSSVRRSRTPNERTRSQERPLDVSDTERDGIQHSSSPSQPWTYKRVLNERSQFRSTTKVFEAEIREARRRLQSIIPKQRRMHVPKDDDLDRRVIFVTHTLPYEVQQLEDGSFRLVDPLQRPPQALVKGHEVWTIGMPTIRSPEGKIQYCEYSEELVEFLMNCGRNIVPVFLDPDKNKGCVALVELFQLFHYIAPPLDSGFRTSVDDWKELEEMSRQFALRVESVLMEGDLIWIHDYPLMLLPRMLRKKIPSLHIAFSFRSVFPSSEVYRILPRREALLRGVLSANLITFHSFQYVRHFQTACTRLLGIECSTSGIEAHPDAGGTGTRLVTIPMGIDPRPYVDCLTSEETQRKIGKLLQSFGNRKVILGVDLLEERKGIPHKLLAFNKFLQQHPEWAPKCVFLQIVIPGDDPTADPEARKNLLQLIHQMAGEINSRFGSFGLVPVHFLDQCIAPEDLVPVFAIASVALCTSLRDVLSMTAFEYLVCNGCQPQQSGSAVVETTPGVLILSEFAGTAHSLRAAALCVNPWNTIEYADAISEAFFMSKEEIATRASYGYSYVMKYTQQRWVNDVMEEIDEIVADDSCNAALRPPPLLNHEEVVSSFQHAGKRLIVLGFSGTLMPRDRYFNPNVLSSSRLPDIMLANLYSLSMDDNTDVIVVSSVSRSLLARALHGVPCWIIAEGGVSYRLAETEEWCGSADHLDTTWMDSVEEVFEYFGDRTPGAFIHKTSCTIAWHFRDTPCGQSGDYGSIQSKELLIHLWAGPLLNAPAETVVGANSVEVRPVDVSKANQLENVIGSLLPLNAENEGYEMIFCAGDFVVRDEDIFQTVRRVARRRGQSPGDGGWMADADGENFFTATVGRKNSRAMFHLVDTDDVCFLLAKFAWALSRSAQNTQNV